MGSRFSTRGQWRHWAVILPFALIIAGPLLATLILPEPTVSLTEKRRLADLPPIPGTLAQLQEFPGQFEAYYNDHFGFREVLTRWYSRVRVQGLADSTNNKVALGKDGWLYYGGQPMAAYRGEYQVSTSVLFMAQALIEGKRDWLSQQGIRYLFVVAPSKQSIYPEYLRHSDRKQRDNLTDRFVAHMATYSDVPVLDLRQPLLQHKPAIPATPDNMLFSKTDSHWSGLGAYYGYAAILRRLKPWFPALAMAPEVDQFPGYKADQTGDLSLLLGVGDALREPVRKLDPVAPECVAHHPLSIPSPRPWTAEGRPFETRCPSAPDVQALVLHDSFGLRLAPWIGPHFRNVRYIGQRNAQHPAEDTFPTLQAAIALRRPDLVIDEVLERKLIATNRFYDAQYQALIHARYHKGQAAKFYGTGQAGQSPVITQLQIQTVATESGWLLTPHTNGGRAILRAFSTPEHQWPIVYMKWHSPSPTRVQLAPWYGPKRSPTAAEYKIITLPAGDSAHFVAIGGRGYSGPVQLTVEPNTSALTLREYAVHTTHLPLPYQQGSPVSETSHWPPRPQGSQP